MGLIIRSSSIHAAGCYTTSALAKGVKVVEYTGPRIPKKQADALYKDSVITYLFGLDDGKRVINGYGTAMFINHSCDPNCETEEVKGKVWVMSLRAIAPGEELTYDYNLYDGDEDEARCYCGAVSCRKTMYSPEEIARRKRGAARKKRGRPGSLFGGRKQLPTLRSGRHVCLKSAFWEHRLPTAESTSLRYVAQQAIGLQSDSPWLIRFSPASTVRNDSLTSLARSM